MIITAKPNGKFNFKSDYLTFKATTLAPDICGEQPVKLNFITDGEQKITIGDTQGTVRTESCRNQGLTITRDFFRDSNSQCVALRLSVENRRKVAIRLRRLTPFAIREQKDFLVAGDDIEHWGFVRQGRNKADVPGFFTLTAKDENYEDAITDEHGVPAGMGTIGNAESKASLESILAEPCLCIRNIRHDKAPGVLFGVIGQHEHLTSFALSPTSDPITLHDFRAVCEYDEAIVSPGERRSTHWIIVKHYMDESSALWDFTQTAVSELEITKPSDPLNVYCNWHFYGYEFTEKDLDENLEYLEKRPIPVDAFILDNGWMDNFGDWNAGERFPGGLKTAADKIRKAGLIPGIWTCPLVIKENAEILKKHPELVARDKNENPVHFEVRAEEEECFAVDPTVPFFKEYMKELYGRLREWGFRYHKLDWLRSITNNENIRFFDRTANRALAYRLANTIIRDAAGEDAYIASCGGINDAGPAGLVDSVRTSSDTYGFWHSTRGRNSGALIRIKQNLVRNYSNLLWNTDPDAVMLVKREEGFRNNTILSLGTFNDEEAFTCVASQYLAGGNVCVSGRIAELDDSRRKMLRHIIPSIGRPAKILDFSEKMCPNLFFTHVVPHCRSLGEWWTLAVGNWEDQEIQRTVDMSELPLPEESNTFAIFEFHDQRFLGLKSGTECFEYSLPPHAMRIFRIVPWNGYHPLLVGTDLHITGGAVEIAGLEVGSDHISGTIESSWDVQVKVTAAFPDKDKPLIKTCDLNASERDFIIRKNA